jgi:hypothetical protein
MMPGITPIVSALAPIENASIAFQVGALLSASATTHTFTDQPIGDAPLAPNKRFVVFVFKLSANRTVTATIGGISAPVIYSANTTAPNSLVTRWYMIAAEVPSGTTATIVVNLNTAAVLTSGTVCTLLNLDGSVVSDTSADAGTGITNQEIDCPAGGGILAVGTWGASTGASTSSANFNNIDTLNVDGIGLNGGTTVAGEIYPSTQTALDIDFDPVLSSGTMSQCTGFAASFAPVF